MQIVRCLVSSAHYYWLEDGLKRPSPGVDIDWLRSLLVKIDAARVGAKYSRMEQVKFVEDSL